MNKPENVHQDQENGNYVFKNHDITVILEAGLPVNITFLDNFTIYVSKAGIKLHLQKLEKNNESLN